jgi:hypothetical protein
MLVEPFSVNRQLVVRAIETCLQALIRIVNDHFGGRFIFLKVALGTVLISILATFPGYKGMGTSLNNPITQALRIKIQHPLSPIPPYLKDIGVQGGAGSHIDKLELRLTIPILGWLSHTGAWTVIVWNHLCALGVFYLLACLASEAINDKVGGAIFVLGLGPTFFGSWFFNDTYCGDGIAFFFLLLSIASRSLLVSCCSFLAAAFCDERCVAAVPLLCLYFLVSLRQETEKSLRSRHCIAIIVGACLWVFLRSWIAGAFHLTMGTSMLATRAVLRYNFTNFPAVFLGVFKASWTLPLFALLSLMSLRKWVISSAFVGVFALAVAPAFLVFDFARSVCYTFIILLVSLHFLWGDRDASRKFLAAILLVNILLIPAGQSILRIVFLSPWTADRSETSLSPRRSILSVRARPAPASVSGPAAGLPEPGARFWEKTCTDGSRLKCKASASAPGTG